MNDCHLTMLGIHAFTQGPWFLSFPFFLEAKIERACLQMLKNAVIKQDDKGDLPGGQYYWGQWCSTCTLLTSFQAQPSLQVVNLLWLPFPSCVVPSTPPSQSQVFQLQARSVHLVLLSTWHGTTGMMHSPGTSSRFTELPTSYSHPNTLSNDRQWTLFIRSVVAVSYSL